MPKEKIRRRRGYGVKRSLVGTIARERMQILMKEARIALGRGEDSNARRYVELAQKISTRTKVRLPREDKRLICKNCHRPLVPGRNARVRLSPEKKTVTITCLSCKTITRYPYSREKKRGKTVNPYMTRPSFVKEFPSQ